jgi:hypothetical protein
MMCHDKFTLLMLHKNGAACLVGAGAESTSMRWVSDQLFAHTTVLESRALFSLETTNLWAESFDSYLALDESFRVSETGGETIIFESAVSQVVCPFTGNTSGPEVTRTVASLYVQQ